MLRLKQIDDKTFVNVGDGNITSVTYNGTGFEYTSSRITFIGGGFVMVKGELEKVVEKLEAEEPDVIQTWGGDVIR